MFASDTLGCVSSFANPISLSNNVNDILATTAFVEVVKYGDGMIDFIITSGGEKDKASNPEIVLDTTTKSAIRGVGLSMTGQSPLVNHGYVLYRSWDKVANWTSIGGLRYELLLWEDNE